MMTAGGSKLVADWYRVTNCRVFNMLAQDHQLCIVVDLHQTSFTVHVLFNMPMKVIMSMDGIY